MLGTRDRPFLEELGKALVVRLGSVRGGPSLLDLGGLQGVKGLPVRQAEPLPDLRFGGLGLAEQVLGVLIVHARHYLPGGDVLPALDRDLHDPLLDLRCDVGLGVSHQGACDVQGRRQGSFLRRNQGNRDGLLRLLGLGRELGLGIPATGHQQERQRGQAKPWAESEPECFHW